MGIYEAFKIETEHFQGELTPTDANTIFISVDEFTLRGITYAVRAHFYKQPTGAWILGQQGDAPSTLYYHRLSVSRRSEDHSKRNDVSHSARVKIAEILTAEVINWTAQNPAALVKAQRDDNAREIVKREEKIASLRREITTLEIEIGRIGGKQ